MTFDVFACGFQRGSGSIQLTTVYLENVPKTVIDLKAGFHIVPACGLGEPFEINALLAIDCVEKDLDEFRRVR